MNANDDTRLMFPALGGLYNAFSSYSYAFMRFATGAVLLPHGIQKIFFKTIAAYTQAIGAKGLPFPELLAYLTFFTEFCGGRLFSNRSFHQNRSSDDRHRNARHRVRVSVAVWLLLDRQRL